MPSIEPCATNWATELVSSVYWRLPALTLIVILNGYVRDR